MKIRAFFAMLALAGSMAAAEIQVGLLPCLVTKGQDCTISWISSGAMAATVNVTVLRGAVVVQQYARVANPPGSHEITWPVPSSLPTAEYTFRVATTDGLVQGEKRSEIREMGIYTDPTTPSGSLPFGREISFSWRAFGMSLYRVAYFDLYRSGVLVGSIGADDMNSFHGTGCGRTASWIVGDLMDPGGEFPLPEKAPAGFGYRIRIRNHDGSIYAETGTFDIGMQLNPGVFRNLFQRISRIPVFPGDCSKCGEVQVEELIEVAMKSPVVREVQLWQAGRLLGKLFESDAAGKRMASRRIDFGSSFPQLKQGGSGFELRVFDNKGKLLHTQPVVLNYKAQ